jgi:hypothetical protein
VTVLVPTSTEKRCAICSSPNRATAEKILGSLGSKVGDVVQTWERLLPLVAAAVGKESVSTSSCKGHRSKHCRVVHLGDSEAPEGDGTAAAVLAEEQAALLADIDQQLAGGSINPTRVRQLQARGALLDLRRKVAAGERLPSLSPDQLGRVLEGIERRQTDAERSELLSALAGGISQVFERALGPAPENPALEPGTIEGEVVEVEDVDEGEA